MRDDKEREEMINHTNSLSFYRTLINSIFKLSDFNYLQCFYFPKITRINCNIRLFAYCTSYLISYLINEVYKFVINSTSIDFGYDVTKFDIMKILDLV